MFNNDSHKLLVAFHERHQSLKGDGYRDCTTAFTSKFHYIKMRHRNGNYVSILANYDECSLTQRTNGKVTHYEEMR